MSDSAELRRPDSVPADTKDWTWVLDAHCPECDVAVGDVDPALVAERIPAQIVRWQAVLRRPQSLSRPRPDVWSPLEYACHVRDVYGVFAERTRLVLERDGASFPDWDQDATAVEARYRESDPAQVAEELADAGQDYAEMLCRVPADAWGRGAVRSNGSRFTLGSLTQYFLHDVEHHLADVGG
ncbi:MAG: DinB family protein [Cellulomonadaceae bacterium]